MKCTGVILLLLIFVSLESFTQSTHAKRKVPFNNPGLTVDLGVGLWAIPLPMDYDNDGDNDLVVSTRDVPSNGTYIFENVGKEAFKPAVKIGEGKRNITISYTNGDPRVTVPGMEFDNFTQNGYENAVEIPFEQTFYSGRTNQWKFADYDGDGITDLVFGVSDWRDYGWDDAYDESGNWTNDQIHGYVYWAKNTGTNNNPVYSEAVKVEADGEPIDVYGCPSPNFVDWDNDGDLDLICGSFLDTISYFENTGSRTEPAYTSRGYLQSGGETIHMELQMLQVTVFDWDQDGDPDIIVGKEDGRVAWIENLGIGSDGKAKLEPPKYFKQEADYIKCGALVTPCSFDWDFDGDEDLICGNTAGFIELIENLDGAASPKWAAPKRLKAGGEVIRYMAGENLSIQGPAEAKWGYTVPFVADWNMDEFPDILVNTIVGKIEWFESMESRMDPVLAPAKPVKVEWEDNPPKPAWNWWNPKEKELVVQWRTRPIVYDLNQDGNNDLIVIDHEGYLSYFKRVIKGGDLITLPGERVFFNEDGEPLRLNAREAGKSGRRKIDLADWDGDGDLDLLINSPREAPKETSNIAWHENIKQDGVNITFRYEGNVTYDRLQGHTTSPTTVDWNGDGNRDLLVGGEDGFLYLYEREAVLEIIVE